MSYIVLLTKISYLAIRSVVGSVGSGTDAIMINYNAVELYLQGGYGTNAKSYFYHF